MFDYDFTSARSFITKSDRGAAYAQFLMSIGVSEVEYPFSFEGEVLYKGRRAVFTVSGFGGYNNADGQWVVFVAYRCAHPVHTIQHSWSWDAENHCVFNYRKVEFIN